MTIRAKHIRGHGPYMYEQKSVRTGKKVKTVHVKYLGKGKAITNSNVVPKDGAFIVKIAGTFLVEGTRTTYSSDAGDAAVFKTKPDARTAALFAGTPVPIATIKKVSQVKAKEIIEDRGTFKPRTRINREVRRGGLPRGPGTKPEDELIKQDVRGV